MARQQDGLQPLETHPFPQQGHVHLHHFHLISHVTCSRREGAAAPSRKVQEVEVAMFGKLVERGAPETGPSRVPVQQDDVHWGFRSIPIPILIPTPCRAGDMEGVEVEGSVAGRDTGPFCLMRALDSGVEGGLGLLEGPLRDLWEEGKGQQLDEEVEVVEEEEREGRHEGKVLRQLA